MKSGRNKQPSGYTIVEVMLVLAISGAMFLIATTFIGGKQQRIAFSEGASTMASQLQGIIEQVSDGSYSNAQVNCHLSSGLPTESMSGNGQGTNQECVFLGKLLHFQAANSTAYEVMTVIGARADTNGNPLTDLGAEKPTVVDDSGGSAFTDQNLTVQDVIPQSLAVHGVSIIDANSHVTVPSKAFGFVQTASSNLSGPGTVNLVYATNITADGASEHDAVSAINNSSRDGLAAASSANICLTDGTQYAVISVGSSSASANQLAVSVSLRGTRECDSN